MEDADIEQDEVATPEEAPQHAGPPGTLRDRYLVRSNQSLPDMSLPNADAYVAEDKKDPNRRLYALICKPDLPPRVNVMRALKGVSSPGLQQLVEWGPMSWPPIGRQCMTVIYERPVGQRVMTHLKGELRKIDEYEITRKFVEPSVAAIKEMTSRGVTHRAIRPTNLYYQDAAGERLCFGDGATSPAAFDQPLVFEAVESAMCMPTARGSGSYSDDLYSLGVTLAFLLLGRNPVAHMDDEAIMRSKIQQGSYITLLGDERLPLPLVEVLRGLLCDDEDQRWDIESLDMWMQGRRLSPLQARAEKRAGRGFPFHGKEYSNCRELAAAMARDWELAIPLVLEGKVELWLRRALEDKERAAAVAEIVRLAVSGGGKAASDLMLCKVLVLLDRKAPIRYKGLVIMPDGFGTALASQMAKRGDTRLLAEAIVREVPKLWFEGQGEYQPDNSVMESGFRELRGYLSQTAIGYGLERCLYEMNDVMPCLSPLLGEEYVVDLKELLPALDVTAAARIDPKQWPCDRHIAAFMGARARSDIDRNLTSLADSDPGVGLMALLNLMAVFQYRLGPEQLPHLTAWLGAVAKPVVSAYHSHEKRKELEKEIPKIVRKGSIVELYQLLDDPNAREKDRAEYAWAQAQYQAAEEEVRRVQSDDEERSQDADRIGRQTAAVTGIIISLATITITVIMTAW
jgi:hypothetical protein